jgi:hypothetical protein
MFNYAWDQLLVFNFFVVGKMSNVPCTFVLKLTILVARFVPFFCYDWLCASVNFIMISKWSSLANFMFAPTFKWWHTLY